MSKDKKTSTSMPLMLTSDDVKQPHLWIPVSTDIIKSGACKSISYNMTESVYSWSKEFNFAQFEKQQTYMYNMQEQLDNLQASTEKLCGVTSKLTSVISDEVIEETESDDDTCSLDFEATKLSSTSLVIPSKPLIVQSTSMTSLENCSTDFTRQTMSDIVKSIDQSPTPILEKHYPVQTTALVIPSTPLTVPSTPDSVVSPVGDSQIPDELLTPKKRKTNPQVPIVGVHSLTEVPTISANNNTISTIVPRSRTCTDHVGDGRPIDECEIEGEEDGGGKRHKKDPADAHRLGYHLFFKHINEIVSGKQREQEVTKFINENKHTRTYKNRNAALSSLNSQKWNALTQEEQNEWRRKAELIAKAIPTFILPKL